MTTILDLPEEILYEIFNDGFDQWDLLEIQSVCRAWYKPAHIALLNNEIYVVGIPAIKKFIEAFDHNPDPAFLKAVKSIEFGSNEEPFQFTEELNQKLLYRFPNLKKVVVESAFLQNFNDDVCKTLLINCPKLESFSTNMETDSKPEYQDLIHNARLVISYIDLDKLEYQSQYGDITQFLSGFPRVQEIYGEENTLLTNFEQLLTILSHTPLLKFVPLGSEIDDGNVAEIYLSSRPKDEQDKLIDRLSKIISLNLFYTSNFCINSFKFVEKYLTGLSELYIHSLDNQSWTETHTKVFCNFIAKVSRIRICPIQFDRMNLDTLTKCFPIAMREVFSLTVNHKKTRHLMLCMADTNYLCIRPQFCGEKIRLILDEQLTLPEISQLFFTPAYNNVDEFTLFTNSYEKANLHDYSMILGQMPSLKQLVLEIPENFGGKANEDECNLKLPLVEDLTILTTPETDCQALIDSYYHALPNLKRLTFFYCPGVWNERRSEFQVNLSQYSLETLCLDVTPVEHKTLEPKGFFVLVVNVSSTDEQRLYKISYNLTSVSRTGYSKLRNYLIDWNYLPVIVTVKNLQNLKLFAHVHAYGCCKNGDDYYSSWKTPRHVMILEDNQWKC